MGTHVAAQVSRRGAGLAAGGEDARVDRHALRGRGRGRGPRRLRRAQDSRRLEPRTRDASCYLALHERRGPASTSPTSTDASELGPLSCRRLSIAQSTPAPLGLRASLRRIVLRGHVLWPRSSDRPALMKSRSATLSVSDPRTSVKQATARQRNGRDVARAASSGTPCRTVPERGDRAMPRRASGRAAWRRPRAACRLHGTGAP